MIVFLYILLWQWMAVLSIVISWVSCAITFTKVAFDLDMNVKKRYYDPWFYGFAPARRSRRKLAQTSLFLFMLAHVICRTSAVSFLYLTSRTWLAAFLAGDMCVYMLYKVRTRVCNHSHLPAPEAPTAAAWCLLWVPRAISPCSRLQLVRRDFMCWIPGTGVGASILFRIINKVRLSCLNFHASSSA
jgi:hypothetical protein